MFRKNSALVLSLILIASSFGNVCAMNFDPTKEISFSDIETLYKVEEISPALNKKLEKIYNTPTIVPVPSGKATTSFKNSEHGQFFRIAEWNIERGHTIDSIKQLFSNPDAFLKENLPEEDYNTERYGEVKEEIGLLKSSDVLFLSEVDWGINRTDYRNITKEIADTVGAGYAYISEFIEVDPKLTTDADPSKYKGLHGSAVVSKFPIKKVDILRMPECHDWYNDELHEISRLEKLRRKGSKIVFKENLQNEVRRGGRVAMLADLEMPNKETLTVINTHLEDRARPDCRVAQGEYLLKLIKHIKNPVVLSGDLNTFEHDLTPTSIGRVFKSKLRDPAYLARTISSIFNPIGYIIYPSLLVSNATRKFKDPSAKHVPLLFPNKIHNFFDNIRDFKFDDGNSFDFSGTEKWTYLGDNTGYLSNSNQRWVKGYVETLQLERSFKVIRFKTDWFFVKPTGTEDNKKYFPAFGRTLKKLNYTYAHNGGRIVDHTPIVVDIILNEDDGTRAN